MESIPNGMHVRRAKTDSTQEVEQIGMRDKHSERPQNPHYNRSRFWGWLPYEWHIGWRYTRTNKHTTGNGFISFIALISTAGIALGVSALIIVLAVMSGFQKEVRDRMLSVLAHIEVLSSTRALEDWRQTAQEARHIPEVRAVAPYIETQALLAHQSTLNGVALRGIDPVFEKHVSNLGDTMKFGHLSSLKAGGFGIVLGKQLAEDLAVALGDTLTLVTPQATTTPAGILPRYKLFKVTGIFESGHYEFDRSLALIHIADAQTLFRLDGPTGIRVRLRDMQQAPQIARTLAGSLSGQLYVRDWTTQNRTWFAAVQIEKRMMFIILMLIIAVAAFNLVSSLVMTVTSKQADIAILRTLGAPPASIMKIFIVQGITIGAIGTALGVVFGCVIAAHIPTLTPLVERALHIQFLPPSIYFISTLPSDLIIGDVVHIGGIAFLLSALATLYPSWRAARVQPAQALRYE